MARYEIDKDEERLLLRTDSHAHFTQVGCPLFLLSVCCFSFLGLLALLDEAVHPGRAESEVQHLLTPSVNPFGVLWIASALVMGVVLPFYITHLKRVSAVFVFNRATNAFLYHGRRLSSLDKIECIRVRRSNDPDGVCVYLLIVIYSDGYERVVEESYDEMQTWMLAQQISDYLKVPLRPTVHRELESGS